MSYNALERAQMLENVLVTAQKPTKNPEEGTNHPLSRVLHNIEEEFSQIYVKTLPKSMALCALS